MLEYKLWFIFLIHLCNLSFTKQDHNKLLNTIFRTSILSQSWDKLISIIFFYILLLNLFIFFFCWLHLFSYNSFNCFWHLEVKSIGFTLGLFLFHCFLTTVGCLHVKRHVSSVLSSACSKWERASPIYSLCLSLLLLLCIPRIQFYRRSSCH